MGVSTAPFAIIEVYMVWYLGTLGLRVRSYFRVSFRADDAPTGSLLEVGCAVPPSTTYRLIS